MKSRFFIGLAAGMLCVGTASAQKADKDTAALLKLEQDWANAVAKHDAEFIERVEAENYVYTDAAGNVGHKADDLATARAADVKIDAFRLSAMKVELHGDAAVVTGITTVSGNDRGAVLGGTYRWTDTFVRRADGSWQAVASQATAVAKSEDAPVLVIPAETPGASATPDTDD